MGQWIKVAVLLFVNIILAGATLYFLDYMRVINYQVLFNQLIGNPITIPTRVEDPYLLEKEELNKKWELLTIKELELSNTNQLFISNSLALQTEQNTLQEEREAFLNEQTLLTIENEEQNSYNVKITEVATQISGMPPQTAAELLNLQDDLQIVDIFKKMEELATANGQASTVPFLLTLMNRDKAARIQTLILANPS